MNVLVAPIVFLCVWKLQGTYISFQLDLSLEVSVGYIACMQGVERIVRIPSELQRFREVPMTVEYELENGRSAPQGFSAAHNLHHT